MDNLIGLWKYGFGKQYAIGCYIVYVLEYKPKESLKFLSDKGTLTKYTESATIEYNINLLKINYAKL